jgi:hypothetical protein
VSSPLLCYGRDGKEVVMMQMYTIKEAARKTKIGEVTLRRAQEKKQAAKQAA